MQSVKRSPKVTGASARSFTVNAADEAAKFRHNQMKLKQSREELLKEIARLLHKHDARFLGIKPGESIEPVIDETAAIGPPEAQARTKGLLRKAFKSLWIYDLMDLAKMSWSRLYTETTLGPATLVYLREALARRNFYLGDHQWLDEDFAENFDYKKAKHYILTGEILRRQSRKRRGYRANNSSCVGRLDMEVRDNRMSLRLDWGKNDR